MCHSLSIIPMTKFPIPATGDRDDNVFHLKTMLFDPIEFWRFRRQPVDKSPSLFSHSFFLTRFLFLFCSLASFYGPDLLKLFQADGCVFRTLYLPLRLPLFTTVSITSKILWVPSSSVLCDILQPFHQISFAVFRIPETWRISSQYEGSFKLISLVAAVFDCC